MKPGHLITKNNFPMVTLCTYGITSDANTYLHNIIICIKLVFCFSCNNNQNEMSDSNIHNISPIKFDLLIYVKFIGDPDKIY